jgi:hypothetical protein
MRRYDEIGYWSEVKLEIISKYASAYSTIMKNQKSIKSYLYVDAFAGAGVHIKKQTREFVTGSPLNALVISPAFPEYHFIDLDGDKVDQLREIVGAEDPNRLYIEFEVQYLCNDLSASNRTDAKLILRGDGNYILDKNNFSDMGNFGEELIFKLETGEEKQIRNSVMFFGGLVLGHKTVEHSVKWKLEYG